MFRTALCIAGLSGTDAKYGIVLRKAVLQHGTDHEETTLH